MKRKMIVALLCVALLAVVFASTAYAVAYGAGISTGGSYWTGYVTGLSGSSMHFDANQNITNNDDGTAAYQYSRAYGYNPSAQTSQKTVRSGQNIYLGNMSSSTSSRMLISNTDLGHPISTYGNYNANLVISGLPSQSFVLSMCPTYSPQVFINQN